MTINNNFIFKALQIVAWLIFVGLCIEAGALLVNFVFTFFKPEMVKNLYQKLDLSEIYAQSQWTFYGIYSFILFIAGLKAYLFYIVISLIQKIDLEKPFSEFATRKIMDIASTTFSIGIISYVARQITKNLIHHGYTIDQLNPFWEDSRAFVLMGAVIYVIAVIFKRGVALQTENDFTV
jgi:hypothetical protein